MYRRQFLRAAVALTGAKAAAAGSAHPDGDSSPGATPTGTSRPTGTVTSTGTAPSSGTATGTPTPEPTPTPTEVAATPTSGWEPAGSVAVDGATEAVVTPDGATAFVATMDGFAAVDLSDPADPTVLAREAPLSPPETDREMREIQDVKYDDGHLLVAGPASYYPDVYRGVVRYDVTDPGSPEFVRAYETTFPVHNCFFRDGVAYLTGNDNDANPLVVVDMGPDPAELARWSVLDRDERWGEVDPSVRTLHDVWVQDGYAYLAYWDAGTWILDVSDPGRPEYVANVTDRPIDDLANDTGAKVVRERTEPPGNDHYVATDPAGTLMAVGQESWNSNMGLDATTPSPDDPGGPSGIELYDVSDRANPRQVATIDPPPTADPNVNGVWTTAHNFDLDERYLYSSWYQGGVKIHDVSDPANPRQVRYFRRSSATAFWTAQLAGPGETVVASSYFDPSNRDGPGAIYTFPDVARETPTPTATPTPSPSATPTPTPAAESAPTTTADPSTAPTDATDDSTTTGDGPGFGALAALTGLGLGSWRLLRDDDAE